MSIGRLSCVAALGAVLLSGGLALGKDFRAAENQPPDYPTGKALKYMGDQLAKYTNGKYNIKVYPSSVLGSGKDTIEQVKLGALDMTRLGSADFNGIVPETLIPSLPFLFRDDDHFRKVMYGPIGDEILAAFEKHGYIGLVWQESGTRSVYSKKAIRSVADMKGMKIRVQPSDLWVAIASSMGAAATPIPYAEVYTALKTGLVDAAENNYPSYEAQKHYEAAPIYSETGHASVPDVVVFSKKVWDTLSKDEHEAIRKAAKDSVPYFSKLWSEREAASRKIVLDNGATIIAAKDIDHAGFVAAAKPVWDKYASTPELKALVQKIIDTK
jgi:tripartite ATP-independent transporter DctP family solute receptor